MIICETIQMVQHDIRSYIQDFSTNSHRLVLAPVLALAPAELRLDNKRTTVNGVDDSVTRVKSEVTPGTRVPDSRTLARKLIVLRVDIEVRDLLDLAAVRVLGNGADVEDSETSLVVGLVGEALVDELVVVDGAGGRLVVAGVLGLLEAGDVPDVGNGEAILCGRVGCGAGRVDLALVEFVIHHEVSLPHGVENPALVSVGCTDVGSAGDDLRSVRTVLVGDVVDGEGILVVAVADVPAEVLLIWATVDDALGIVGVTILGSTASLVGLVRVVHVDEDGTTSTGVIAARATTTANSDGVAKLLVGNDVVRTARDTIGDVHPANVLLDVEGLGVLRAQVEQLLHVEELDAVTCTLRSDDQGIADLLDLAPDDTVVAGGQAAEVFELTLLGDLCEGCTVCLANGNKLSASLLVSPTPAARALTDSITELCVSLEVVHILEAWSAPAIPNRLTSSLTMSLQE